MAAFAPRGRRAGGRGAVQALAGQAGAGVGHARVLRRDGLARPHLLTKKGISVITAENGRIGADIFAGSEIGEFDAILMDMRMSVMDGLEATKTIRAQNREDANRVPIIAMTANAFDDDRKATADAGMNAHLSKPVEPHELYDILKMLISEYRKE